MSEPKTFVPTEADIAIAQGVYQWLATGDTSAEPGVYTGEQAQEQPIPPPNDAPGDKYIVMPFWVPIVSLIITVSLFFLTRK